MPDALRLVSRPADPKARLISIFAGAVLLPSLALSILTFRSVPGQAEAFRMSMFRQGDRLLAYVERDLEQLARGRALEAARIVGTERLLDGRQDVIQQALEDAGFGTGVFESLRLEASSSMARRALADGRSGVDMLTQALDAVEAEATSNGEDAVVLTNQGSEVMGTLRFRYSCGYAHGRLLNEYFDREQAASDPAWVIRVTEPNGYVLYESAPTANGKFEIKHAMASPSFQGMKLQLRRKEKSINETVRLFQLSKMAMILFIDLLLGAGLYLVYANVRRETHLARLKSDFVANVSHELKTPLALIRLFAETLELGRVPSERKAKEYYRVINKESHRLTRLIENILDFSKIEAGRKQYRMAPTELGGVVEEVIEAYRFPIEQQGFTLEVDLADDVPEVWVDREAISQALINLLNNAIKYSRDDKRIGVRLASTGGRVVLSVTDHGIGIPKSEQRRIFEKFYRVEDSLVHETKGSGLGLALVQHIMEAHGGSVDVESAVGKGSRFLLSLPIEGEATVPARNA